MDTLQRTTTANLTAVVDDDDGAVLWGDASLKILLITIPLTECLLVLGNIPSILVYSRGNRSRTDISPLLINLSIADLFTLIWLPMIIVCIIREVRFQELPYCPIMYACQITSILTHLLISVHRFIAIRFQMLIHRLTNTYMAISIALIWMISVSSAMAGWLAGVCYDDTNAQVSANVFRNIAIFVIVTFIIPLASCSVLYSLTGLELWGKKIVGAGLSARRQLKRRKKVIKMLAIVVLMFTVSWLPWTTLLLYDAYSSEPSDSAVGIAFVVAISNSFQNPILYFIFNKNYRNDLKELLCCLPLKRMTGSHPQPTYNLGSATEGGRANRSTTTRNSSIIITSGHRQS